MANLQTSFVRFTAQKKSEIVQKVQIERSINRNSKRYQK